MAILQYSFEQIQELRDNPYVKSCSERYITFTTECKVEVIRLSRQGLFYKDIFQKLGFPSYVVDSHIPKSSYMRWKRNLENWILERKKWKSKKEVKDFDSMSLMEQNTYLQAENAYLKEFHKTIYWHYP